MSTESNPSRRAGFTLLEVLVSMVILAVGLMGLGLLGVGAARSVALADRTTRATVLAGERLEHAMMQVRRGTLPAPSCTVVEQDSISQLVDLSDPDRPGIQITVRPGGPGVRPLVTLSSYVYFGPNAPFTGVPVGSDCGW